jgi:cytochrome P450
MTNAVDELLRHFPPVSHQARTAVRDTEVLGQPIAAGERMLIWLGGVNYDPRHFPDPMTVDLARPNARDHVSFSAGHHRCLGSPLAKIEIQHMLETIYAALPELSIDHDGIERYPNLGTVAGYMKIPATFRPGAPLELPELD